MNTIKNVILTLIGAGFVTAYAIAGDIQAPMTHQDMKMEKMHGKTMMDMRTGTLTGAKGHHAAGKVTFEQEMGKDLLRLSGIKVDKVPDGHVYLAMNGDRAQGVDLGILKRFSGDVTFALPAGTNVEAYDTVIIHCEKFDVEIGRAPLHAEM